MDTDGENMNEEIRALERPEVPDHLKDLFEDINMFYFYSKGYKPLIFPDEIEDD